MDATVMAARLAEALRDELIAAMAGLPRSEWDGTREVARLRIVHGAAADRLLPVVREIADRRAAEELEAAAAEGSDRYGTGFRIVPAARLSARAAALRGETGALDGPDTTP